MKTTPTADRSTIKEKGSNGSAVLTEATEAPQANPKPSSSRQKLKSVSAPRPIAGIPGDGIGKEVIPEAVKVLRAAAAAGSREARLTELDWGADRYLKDGTTLPADAVEMFHRDFDAILLGAMGDPRVPTNVHAADIL